MIVYGIDVSNWQGSGQQVVLDSQRERASHVVVRLSTESGLMRGLAVGQISALVERGYDVGGYIWCRWQVDPVEHTKIALDVTANVMPAGPPVAWFDVEEPDDHEQGYRHEWLARAVDWVEGQRVRAGCYFSVKSWFELMGAEPVGFERLLAWFAHPGSAPSLDDPLLPFAGWTRLHGKQYRGDPLDLDVFDLSVTGLGRAPEALELVEVAETYLSYELTRDRVRKRVVRDVMERLAQAEALLDR